MRFRDVGSSLGMYLTVNLSPRIQVRLTASPFGTSSSTRFAANLSLRFPDHRPVFFPQAAMMASSPLNGSQGSGASFLCSHTSCQCRSRHRELLLTTTLMRRHSCSCWWAIACSLYDARFVHPLRLGRTRLQTLDQSYLPSEPSHSFD